MHLDDKQRRLIAAWLGSATAPQGDEYGRFMAAWIAFNAFCYASFAEKATRRRPDLSDDRGLDGLVGRVPAEGSLEQRADGRVRLRINRPGRIEIDIRERYTEDIIFAEFARKYKSSFIEWLQEAAVTAARDRFLTSLKRPQGYYVINMLRGAQHSDEAPLDDLTKRNIVVAVKDPDNLAELVDALYQVRCNVFHGEKVPGNPNDDRIVKNARPLLIEILTRALA
jgi:hypothetical protein